MIIIAIVPILNCYSRSCQRKQLSCLNTGWLVYISSAHCDTMSFMLSLPNHDMSARLQPVSSAAICQFMTIWPAQLLVCQCSCQLSCQVWFILSSQLRAVSWAVTFLHVWALSTCQLDRQLNFVSQLDNHRLSQVQSDSLAVTQHCHRLPAVKRSQMQLFTRGNLTEVCNVKGVNICKLDLSMRW